MVPDARNLPCLFFVSNEYSFSFLLVSRAEVGLEEDREKYYVPKKSQRFYRLKVINSNPT